ncbi:TetR family transcriptional regulator [Paenibacillus cellulosilyticus]|uniref:TetR family transcriptional regulator n=1 Tax=Paenibacillus cellulosilyticus TaxID=375489 RepID=A0A2V2Z4Q7_9BACL|nr:TetR/AcrR family transcriptional regulator [Paenibacillus cellulosilyticus]PWW08780.1 TetR family transcriptional regulator [Paenibacillus cellulosilyticus]QKS48335.1 TetR/AcrR family transcriptional regulator [Paenibacillus cellulosilyticus]
MKNSNDTKQKLIDVTRQMIDTHGVDSVSMRDLGKEMNLSRGAVYVYFKNKDDLLAALTTENFDTLNSRMNKLIKETSDPRKLIYELLYTFYDFGVKNQEHCQLMFRKQWDKEQYHNLHLAAIETFRIIYSCLETAHEQKRTISKPPKQLTAMVSAFIAGLVDLNSAGHLEPEKGLDDPAGLIYSFVDLIIV